MQYYSMKRDEDDRCAYWCNIPTDVRPGVCGTHYLSIVDIDEAGFYTSACERKWGYAIKGKPARSLLFNY